MKIFKKCSENSQPVTEHPLPVHNGQHLPHILSIIDKYISDLNRQIYLASQKNTYYNFVTKKNQTNTFSKWDIYIK